MRFSKKKYPVLALADNKIDTKSFFSKVNALKCDGVDLKLFKFCVDQFIASKIPISISCLTQSFLQSIINSHEKIFDDNFVLTHKFQKSKMIFLGPNGLQIMFLNIHNEIIGKTECLAIKMLNNVVYGTALQSFDDNLSPFVIGWMASNLNLNQQEQQDSLLSFGFNFLGFKEFAPRKEKILPPKKKIKEFHCKYLNESEYSVSVYDLNWFTESKQLNPFIVRGHWRLQHYGVGRKKRKLKWIDPYMKESYTKGAYMEN